MQGPKLNMAIIGLLKNYGSRIEINDVNYFLSILFSRGEQEYFRAAFSGTTSVPKGFSEGELLEIRRELITRYLDEIPEAEDDPYNHPRLWYLFLIRPDVYSYLRGEDVRQIVSEMIRGHASQEQAQPQRAAYIRGILKDTLENLDREESVVAELHALSQQYPHSEYLIRFARNIHSREPGKIIVENNRNRMVRAIQPRLQMIAREFGFTPPPAA